MADYGPGSNPGPVYVDVYGTGRRLGLGPDGRRRKGGPEQPGGGDGKHGFEGPHPDGPFWLRGVRGTLPLWLAFWGGFFFGHGILIAFTVGAILFATVFGLAIDPEQLGPSHATAILFAGAVAAVTTTFVAWSAVTVWRCAPNVEDMKWIWPARGFMVLYVAAWGAAVWNMAT